jgi:hypothetical protein
MANENIRKSYGGAAAATVLVGTITASSTTLNALDASSYPDGSIGPFVIRLDGGQSNEEKVLISGRAGNVLTAVERGYDGTAAVTHSDVSLTHCLDSHSIDQANQMANVGTAGVAGAVPLWNGTEWGAGALPDIDDYVLDTALTTALADYPLTTALDDYALKTESWAMVNHGATASTARPTGWAGVIWYGSVQPDNITGQDIVIRTDEAT